MKKEMIATIGMFCAASLFAQAFNTTYYAPNGVYGGSSQTTMNGNSTRTTFTTKTARMAGALKLSVLALVRRRRSTTRTACMAEVHGHPKMAIRSTRPITMQMACMADAPKARLSGIRRPHSTMARTVCRPAGRSRQHSATRQQPGITISTGCPLDRRLSTTTPSDNHSERAAFNAANKSETREY